jgi:hypothetical protein
MLMSKPANPEKCPSPRSSARLEALLARFKGLQAETLWREQSCNSLLTYASRIEIPGVPIRPEDDECEEFRPVETRLFAAHHRLWLEALQRVEDGQIKHLLGIMPPGAAKSTYTSIVLPTHYLGRFPGSSIIMASYGKDLPAKFGRKARSIIKQPVYRRIFDTGLSPESHAADQWALLNGSEFFGSSIMAGITGHRADGIIWDDPVKGREEADSEIIRNRTWEAYIDDLLPRKKPGGSALQRAGTRTTSSAAFCRKLTIVAVAGSRDGMAGVGSLCIFRRRRFATTIHWVGR